MPHPSTCLETIPSGESEAIVNASAETTSGDSERIRFVHERFANLVGSFSHRIAVEHQTGSITYEELNRKANQLANHMMAHGIAAGARVGICLNRSAEMIAAVLAVLKTGAAYIPVDANLPAERIAYMIPDSGASCILTQEPFSDSLIHSGCRLLSLSDWTKFESEDSANPSVQIEGNDLAYIIYTSGSTGMPKGVAMPHHVLSNLIDWQIRISTPRDDCRSLQFASLSFDVSFQEIFATFLSGGTLLLIEDETRRDSNALLQFLVSHSVDRVFLPFVALQHLCEVAEEQHSIGLKLKEVITAGEQLHVTETIRNFFRHMKDCRLLNQYGPSETHVVTEFVLEGDPEKWPALPPIGRPIPKAKIHILNEHLQQVPQGTIGEIFIAGDVLATGYVNKPQLTAERFLGDPYSDVYGAKMYKTGDLGRLLPDGNIEFCGRSDFQVKIRGYRIELGEIQSVLNSHPHVSQSVVTAFQDENLRKYLVAYVESRNGAEICAGDLKDLLKGKLPEYMIPSAFVIMDQLPLNSNGKVDRAKLPVPSQKDFHISDGYVAPQTELENLLAGIWKDLFHFDQIGVNDDFFELGGNSLLATRMLARVRKSTTSEISLHTFFQHKTIRKLAGFLEGRTEDRANFDPWEIHPVERSGKIPLAFSQQRLWFLDQWETNSAVFNISSRVILEGTLDAPALEKALSLIMERHEALRTCISNADGQSVQVIAPFLTLPLINFHLTDLDGTALEAKAMEIAREEAKRPFQLSQAPLCRFLLLKLSENRHWLVVTMHHIISDGWSLGIFFEELSTLYRKLVLNEEISQEPLPVQYADYASWQRTWMSGDVLKRRLDYWREKLKGSPALLELPTDFPRPANQTFHGSRCLSIIPASLLQRIHQLSQQENCTSFMTLLAAFQVLLFRYCGQEDVVVGSPIAGRNHEETENLIGFFVNNLVLRSRINPEDNFLQLLSIVRETTLEAYDHQDLPFEKLVEELNPERSPSYPPLFQVFFALQNYPVRTSELPRLMMSTDLLDTGTAKYDLSLYLTERTDGLEAVLEYNTNLFSPATMERMLGHFQQLLEEITAQPTLEVSKLNLLTPSERRVLLVEWNSTRMDYPRHLCVQYLFEEQAVRNPENIAVQFGNTSITYAELNRRANQVASHLIKLGVQPEVLVGICADRSIDLIVALLGILKAGGAYMPLDPAFPEDRLRFMVEDSGAGVLLVSSQYRRIFDGLHLSKVAGIEELGQDEPAGAHENPGRRAQGNHLVYVLYTSGSTGKPKGIQIAHHSLVNFLLSMKRSLNVSERDSILGLTTISFDISGLEIYLPLISCARLELAGRETASDGELLKKFLEQREVTILQATPATWQMLISTGWKGNKSCKILCGGEAVTRELANELQKRCDTLWNVYGPTETTIWSTIYPVDRDGSSVSIGRPIDNTLIYILDRHLQPLPVGVPGELFIGGDGVARGYLNRPELTAEKFIINPFNEQGDRIYRTGDLARYRHDGNIECLGRTDHQVKIRGFRIELGEIEAVLAEHEEVHECAVAAKPDSNGDKRLVAYFTPRKDPDPKISVLRDFLRSRLPDYMVPSTFVRLSELPLTPNGKVDRKRLPDPNTEDLVQTSGACPPRTSLEQDLARAWCEVLGLKQIGIHDNFFEAGGHSLRAVQVLSRIRKTMNKEIPLRLFFENPTIAGLAQLFESTMEEKSRSASSNETTEQSTRMMPASFAQRRLWFLDHLNTNKTIYNIPWTMQCSGELNLSILEESINAILRRHESLRTTFTSRDGQAIQVIAPAKKIRIPINDLSSYPEDYRTMQADKMVREEACRPFDLTQGPLFRCSLIRLQPQEHILMSTWHHSVCDGWSVHLFFQELISIYRSMAGESQSNLPDLPIQYSDFVRKQQESHSEALRTQMPYWRENLRNAPLLLELPTDRPRPATQSFKGTISVNLIEAETAAEVAAFSKERKCTVFMSYLAAFYTLLMRYSNQMDILIGTPVAGRTMEEAENLIGFFVNTLVVRTKLEGNPTFDELLSRVKDATLGAFSNQDVPFENLVEEVNPKRSSSYSPLFQVAFAYQNYPVMDLNTSRFNVRLKNIYNGTSKYDLTLFLIENQHGSQELIVEYSSDLFDSSTIERMIQHYKLILEKMVRDPRGQMWSFPLLTPDEFQCMVMNWNQTSTNYPREFCVHELFEIQASQTPDAIAVITDKESLSYSTLNERSNLLANYLIHHGLKPGALVGVYMERSAELIISLLAILKAGGAYVPLDLNYPPDRIAYMVENSGAFMLLTQSHHLRKAGIPNIEVVALDQIWSRISEFNGPPPTVHTRADSLIYVIYTSGSTGKPKGVAVSHRAVNRLLINTNYIHISSRDIIAQASNSSFDAATFEIWGALLHGATMVVIPRDVLLSPARLAAQMEQHQITILFLTTALFNQLAAAIPESLKKVRNLLFGGEAVDPGSVSAFLKHKGSGRLLHVYGPTEATTFATWYQVQKPPANAAAIPIGKPIANTEIYILDPYMNPVPVGVPGELYIGGDGVAHGYLNDSELTGNRFLNHPFKERVGKIYKTGDRARFQEDGNIEFLGRLDHQVKIRGFRIEFGEIESVLRQHPMVREAVVLLHENAEKEKSIVAYFTPATTGKQDQEELRAFLSQKLPEYMLPSLFISLKEMPLTPNGKVNRDRLPVPESVSLPCTNIAAARDALEYRITRIWEKILGRSGFGIHSSFFDVGGHSLLAVRLLNMLEKSFRKNIPLPVFFQNPTIEKLAQLLRQDSGEMTRSCVVPIQPSGANPAFFCIPGGGDSVITFRHLSRHMGSQHPFFGLQPYDLNLKSPPYDSIDDLAKQFIEEMQKVQPEGPYYIGGHCSGSMIAFEMARQLGTMGADVRLLAMIDPPWMFFPENALFSFKDRVMYHLQKWCLMDLKGKWNYFVERLNSIASRMKDRIRAHFDDSIRYTHSNVIRLCSNYRPSQISVPLNLYLADDIYLNLKPENDPRLIWKKFSTRDSRIFRIPGGHNSLLQEPNVVILAEGIRSSIAIPSSRITPAEKPSQNHQLLQQLTAKT